MPLYNDDDYNNTEELMLTEGMNMRDLIDGGASFTLQSNLQEYNEEDELFPELMTGDEGVSFEDAIATPWEQPFAELIPSMTELTLHDMDGIRYTIYKKIAKPSLVKAEMTTNGRYRVTVDYNAYYERETIPFDSTRMRGVPYTFITDDQSVLPGFSAAVASMKSDEDSQFIIPYQLLYGELGCEPRVRKGADALFVIKLIKFAEIGDEEATEKNVSTEDRKKYHVMIKHVMDVKASGIDSFHRGAYVKAASAFHKAIICLANCRLANEEEEKECQQHLIKLYANAMAAYNNLDNPKKVCTLFNELSAQSDTRTNANALYQHGRALISLGEFDRAKDALKRAKNLKPGDEKIAGQLKILDKKHAAYKSAEKSLWKKAFGNDEPIHSTQESSKVTEKFKETVKELVNDFNNNAKEKEKNIPTRLNNDEMQYIRDLCKDFNIKLVIPPEVQGKKICYLLKNTVKP